MYVEEMYECRGDVCRGDVCGGVTLLAIIPIKGVPYIS